MSLDCLYLLKPLVKNDQKGYQCIRISYLFVREKTVNKNDVNYDIVLEESDIYI